MNSYHNILKTFYFILLSSIIVTGYSQNNLIINFEWMHDTLNGELFEKTSMHIPVHFEGDTTTYYFQFDTGANKSYLYLGDPDKLDLDFIVRLNKKGGIESDIGKIHLLATNSNSVYHKNGRIHIGTIGADFLNDKKIEIDFEKQTIHFIEAYYNEDYSFIDIKLSYGRPVIQTIVRDKKYNFLFDTGSSLFELWTTKKLWKKWKDPKSSIKGFPISSWGKINTAYRTDYFQKTSLFHNKHIPIKTVWYNSNRKFNKIFKKSKVHGIIGNKPFLNQILLLDIKNKKMGFKN